MTLSDIILEIDKHLKKSGCQYYNQLYVGVTNDPERRLFTEHNVEKNKQWWIYVPADTETIAREAEKHYLDLGMKGNKGGGNGTEDCKFVYSYVISYTTKE